MQLRLVEVREAEDVQDGEQVVEEDEDGKQVLNEEKLGMMTATMDGVWIGSLLLLSHLQQLLGLSVCLQEMKER